MKKDLKLKQTIRELIEEAKLDSDNYLVKEQRTFNFQKYVNFVVVKLAKQNGITQSLAFNTIFEKGLEVLKDADFKEIVKEKLSK